VATHNHFVLDRGGKVFNRSAPVIKLPEGATEDDHLALLGVINSSTACFWLRQVSQGKAGSGLDGVCRTRNGRTAVSLPGHPRPPKYQGADFQKQSYWRHRDKLDVPKERSKTAAPQTAGTPLA
jgi:hypothetical protein